MIDLVRRLRSNIRDKKRLAAQRASVLSVLTTVKRALVRYDLGGYLAVTSCQKRSKQRQGR